MDAVGMSTGEATVAGHRIPIDMAEPSSLADAVALLDVLENRLDFGSGDAGVEEWGALAFGEAGFAGAATKHAFGLVGAVTMADGEVFEVSLAVVRAVRIEAAEARQDIHSKVRRSDHQVQWPVTSRTLG
jgi:hypothetical protein